MLVGILLALRNYSLLIIYVLENSTTKQDLEIKSNSDYRYQDGVVPSIELETKSTALGSTVTSSPSLENMESPPKKRCKRYLV